MTEVELARRNLLVALIIDFHRTDVGGYGITSIMQRYSLKSSRLLVDGSIGFWEKFGWIGVDRSTTDFAPRIKVAHYGEALEQLLSLLNGTQFDVFWDQGRVLTDATAVDDLPIPTGWELATFENPKAKKSNLLIAKNPVDWSKWGTLATIVGLPLSVLLAWYFT